MNNQNRSLTIEEFNLVKPENLKKSEISLNDDIPPRINLKINDVHTVKAEEEEEFYPGHQDLLQLKEELLDIEKDHLAIEDTNLNKTENLEVKNEVQINLDNEKRSLSIEDTSLVKSENLEVENDMVNLNMKSNELQIKDFHTVKTKDGMVFYPCRVIINKETIKGSTKNYITCKRCINNSVYDGIIKEKSSECKCVNGDVTIENLVKGINNENKLPKQKGKKLVREMIKDLLKLNTAFMDEDLFNEIYLLIDQLHTTPFNVCGSFGFVVNNAVIIKVVDDVVNYTILLLQLDHGN
ncbi:uncharacterized protein LOC142317932 [Lycorma delicatula]|uniref:uncharacterized protein LOC142317930 n=1 Tax=Lycorma delicatula TaxID=130591 RepID=UPI003F50D964